MKRPEFTYWIEGGVLRMFVWKTINFLRNYWTSPKMHFMTSKQKIHNFVMKCSLQTTYCNHWKMLLALLWYLGKYFENLEQTAFCSSSKQTVTFEDLNEAKLLEKLLSLQQRHWPLGHARPTLCPEYIYFIGSPRRKFFALIKYRPVS